MKLWKLEYLLATYGDAAGFVVRAGTEQEARTLVAESLIPESPLIGDRRWWGAEGPDVWTDHESSLCTPIEPDGNPEVVFWSYVGD